MLPPISDPLSPPNIATQPAATQPTKGIVLRVGAALAPIDVPTKRPVPSALPIALMHASLFRAAVMSPLVVELNQAVSQSMIYG